MNIAVVGAGRIGGAIADASVQAGHSAHRLRSSTDPSTLRSVELDLILLAAAVEDAGKYDDFEEFRQSVSWIEDTVSSAVPLASVTSLSLKQLGTLAGSRPCVRFMCSSAVRRQESLRFFDAAGDVRAIERLRRALPGRWQRVGREDFDRYTRLLIVSALHCALLSEIETHMGLDENERSFLVGTLDEARRMIDVQNGSPDLALESARTPGGLTQALTEGDEFEQVARQLVKK